MEKGDLLFNWRSGSPEHIGKTALFDLDGSYTYASFVLRIRCGDKINNKYLFYLLNFLREIEFYTKNTAKQVNFKLNAAVFRELQIPVAPLKDQNEIVRKLDDIDESLKKIESKLATNKLVKTGLFGEMF